MHVLSSNKNIRIFFSVNFHFLVVKFSVYLNRHVFAMEYSNQTARMGRLI